MHIYKLMLEHMTDQQRFNLMMKLIVEVDSVSGLFQTVIPHFLHIYNFL